MHDTLYPITRQHKLKRIEEEFLRRLRTQGVPAYERTAQDFFTYVARELEHEKEQMISSFARRGSKHYRTRITYQEEIVMIQELMECRHGEQPSIAKKYNISLGQMRNIMNKYNLQA